MIRQVTIAVLLSLLLSFSAIAQDAKLIEAAKKESGPIVAYGSLGIQHRGADRRSIQEKNRIDGRILARLGDQSDGSRLGRTTRRQIGLRCHGQQQRRHPGNEKGRVFAKYISPQRKRFPRR